MSTLNHLFDLPEQICYVECGLCTTMLLVSVPCRSLSMVVTVRCGHCTGLLSVNLMNASFVPLHLLASLKDDKPNPEKNDDPQKVLDWCSPSVVASADYEEDDIISVNRIVNKPPEKRQRAPSAYNCFIKEEIQRLKAKNPNMAHKEAFSTAAKNWAHFPSFQYKGDGDYSQTEENVTWESQDTEVHEDDKGFRERKCPKKRPQENAPN
ncbi:axial regulator YABBY 4 isoform X1 [Corylus avellana]|uniref:axial regulator YABBY 4 isoform X1 n=1 Tax=Corylus avellana TaxID=13451 RepID=UPI00286D35CF|nr:axial regulator YABBY 4 isoform X1 [Corylus avellana]